MLELELSLVLDLGSVLALELGLVLVLDLRLALMLLLVRDEGVVVDVGSRADTDVGGAVGVVVDVGVWSAWVELC